MRRARRARELSGADTANRLHTQRQACRKRHASQFSACVRGFPDVLFGDSRDPADKISSAGGLRMIVWTRHLAACVVAVAATWGTAQAAYIPLMASELAEPDDSRRDLKAENDLYCLALAVYFEEGSTSDDLDGQRRIAQVVTERARADRRKWGGRDICEVVFYKRSGVCQFSFACLPLARRTPRGGSRWHQAMAIASEALLGTDQDSGEARYYMNPAITSDRNACRFRKEFVPVFDAGRHAFFREPTEEERRALAASDPVECQRYKAAIELKKKLAKIAAEKRRKALLAKAKKSKRARYAGK